jgi:acyl-coenzyme A thioesterase PaaI-like protein
MILSLVPTSCAVLAPLHSRSVALARSEQCSACPAQGAGRAATINSSSPGTQEGFVGTTLPHAARLDRSVYSGYYGKMKAIPAGFQAHFRKSPATDPWEPLYTRRSDRAIDLFVEVRAAHCNARGILHGGVLAALFDNVMGLSLHAVLGKNQTNIVTINLGLDYIGSAKIGDSLLILPRVLRAGGSIGFCDAFASCDDRPIARANATFRVRGSESPTPSSDSTLKPPGFEPGFSGPEE